MSSNMYVAWVYILKCSDDSYYTGKTQEIDKRIEQHNQGFYKKAYTFSRRPVRLIWSAGFKTYKEAIMCELQIKGWSRAKKEALISGKVDLLHFLAECKNESHFKHQK